MSYISQTSEPDRGVQNRSPEPHFNPLLKEPKQSETQKKIKLLKTVFQKAVVCIPEVSISLHSRENFTTKATEHLV